MVEDKKQLEKEVFCNQMNNTLFITLAEARLKDTKYKNLEDEYFRVSTL